MGLLPKKSEAFPNNFLLKELMWYKCLYFSVIKIGKNPNFKELFFSKSLDVN